MSWFDEDDSMQNCKACEMPLGQPLVCYACLCSLCSGCAVSTGEGELCPECHNDMLHFLADAEVTHAPQVSHDGEVHVPRAG